MNLKRTPLYEKHLEQNGKMVDFGGWELPVQYQGILKEHEMVRTHAGLFDVSHMGEVEVKGAKAEDFVQYLTTNDVRKVSPGQVQYTLMCYENGGVVDDLLVYKYAQDHYFLVINAANTDKDFAWMKEHAPEGLRVENVSSQYAQLALQGPKAQAILQQLTDENLDDLAFFHFAPSMKVAGMESIVSRTGYTGEDGFEIYLPSEKGPELWDAILQAGGSDVCPVGLGARDTLRFESKLPLYGQEIDQDISPLEAGLGFFVKLNADDFIGKQALAAQKEAGLKRKQVEFIMLDRGIPRSHYEVEKDGQVIGHVSTGAFAPTLRQNIGLALIDSHYANEGETIDIIIRNKAVQARIGKGIFYKKQTRSK